MWCNNAIEVKPSLTVSRHIGTSSGSESSHPQRSAAWKVACQRGAEVHLERWLSVYQNCPITTWWTYYYKKPGFAVLEATYIASIVRRTCDHNRLKSRVCLAVYQPCQRAVGQAACMFTTLLLDQSTFIGAPIDDPESNRSAGSIWVVVLTSDLSRGICQWKKEVQQRLLVCE